MISYKKIFNTFVFLLFISFLVLYFSQASGYYDELNNRKTELTKEQIKRFEEDVKNGKMVDIKDYMKENTKNYSNRFSSFGLFTSKLMGDTFKWSINGIFEKFDKMVNN